jgi:L-ascorbate 6-phosphate lactonase
MTTNMNMKLYKSGPKLVTEIQSTQIPSGMAAVWAIGQVGVIIRLGGRILVVDPFLSGYPGTTPWLRKFAPPISPEELQRLDPDLILISHHHGDHMDPNSLGPLRGREGTRIILPKAHTGLIRSWGFGDDDAQLLPMNHGETVLAGEGLEITAYHAMHDTFETNEAGEHNFLGYLIKADGITIYHAGDTIGFPELPEWLREQKVDILFIPINGRDYERTATGIVGNCNYREAADIAAAAGVDLVVPVHFGMYPHNDENPAYFVDYLYSRYPQQKFHMMTPGERFIYMK